MPQVVIEQPGVPPMTFALMKNETLFGRADDCDVVLVADEVSRNHARIVMRNGQTMLLDLKSLNGTYVNRQRVVERVLSHMDEIWFGSKCRLVFRDDTQSGAHVAVEEPKRPDSQIAQSVDRIRAEMERVGNSMTMIGRQTPTHPAYQETPAVTSTPDEMVRIGRAYRRLAALHKASNIMASHFDLRKRLAEVLDLVLEVMDGERGFVMLREEGTNSLNVKIAREMGRDLEASSPSMGIAGRAAIDGEAVLLNDAATDNEFNMRESIIQYAIASAMCVPLRVEDRVLGSIYVDTRKPEVRFNEEDLELFVSLAAQSAMAIDNVRLHDQVVEAEKQRQDFARFLSPDVVDQIMREGASFELGGQKTVATTLFCDIRGFTNISERLSPQAIVALLNEHFTAMTECIFEYKGSVNKFIGDEIMAVFGAPIGTGDDEFNAVRAALAMQGSNEALNREREAQGRPVIHLGIGIDTGEVSAGYIGSPQRMEYTVIGDRVNTASRFCSMAEAGQILAGSFTWEPVADRVQARPIGTVVLKGKEVPVHAHEIIGLL